MGKGSSIIVQESVRLVTSEPGQCFLENQRTQLGTSTVMTKEKKKPWLGCREGEQRKMRIIIVIMQRKAENSVSAYTTLCSLPFQSKN